MVPISHGGQEELRCATEKALSSSQQVQQMPQSAWAPAATHFADPFLVTAFGAAAVTAKVTPVIIRLGRLAINALRLL